MDGENVQAVVEILAKTAGGHRGFEVAVGGGDDAQVHLSPLEGPDRAEFALLHQPQQFDLHFQREIANLIEKCGTAVGQFDQPFFIVHRSAKGALHMAEKLALHERSHQGTAVDGDELATRIGVVDGAGRHLLAGAAFSQQEHGQTSTRRLADQPSKGVDGCRLPE